MAAVRDSSLGLTVLAWLLQAGLSASSLAPLWSTLQVASWGAFQTEGEVAARLRPQHSRQSWRCVLQAGVPLLLSSHAGASHVVPQAPLVLSRPKGAAVTVPSACRPSNTPHPILPEIMLSHDSEFWLNAPFPQRSSSTLTKTGFFLYSHSRTLFIPSGFNSHMPILFYFFCLNSPPKCLFYSLFSTCAQSSDFLCTHGEEILIEFFSA